MKISVIIPMYNAVGSIERCLKSVVDQSFCDLEIIVVDDGSTDGSGQKAREIAVGDSRISVISQENKGLIGARKTGIQAASGDYVLFVDSDDHIDPDMIEDMVAHSENGDVDVILEGARFWMGDRQNKALNYAAEGMYSGRELEELKKTLLCAEDYCTMQVLPFLWNKMFKRDLIKPHVLEADEKITIGEDVAIGFPAILKAHKIYVSSKAHYNYIKGEGTMMSTKNEEKEFSNAIRLYGYLKTRFQQLGYGDDASLKGVRRLFINQLFTRAYESTNSIMRCTGLYPFIADVAEQLIIYGAGEFGKEVFARAFRISTVKYWIDRNAEAISDAGHDISKLDDCEITDKDEILVAVLNRKTAGKIAQSLIEKGAAADRIHVFELTDSQEQELIQYGEDHYLRN